MIPRSASRGILIGEKFMVQRKITKQRVWAIANRAKVNKYRRAWAKKNRDKVNEYKRRYKKRKKLGLVLNSKSCPVVS